MNAIAAVSLNWGLGKDNDLLFHISEDMKHFRTLTSGGTVIMGRKTLDSMPGGKALPKRRNIVITRDRNFQRDNVEVVHSIEEALALVAGEDPEKVWVIGGGEIYKAMLPHCSRCCMTKVYAQPECEVFFPNLDEMEDWQVACSETVARDGELEYQFIDYMRKP